MSVITESLNQASNIHREIEQEMLEEVRAKRKQLVADQQLLDRVGRQMFSVNGCDASAIIGLAARLKPDIDQCNAEIADLHNRLGITDEVADKLMDSIKWNPVPAQHSPTGMVHIRDVGEAFGFENRERFPEL